jgi:DNA-binding PadR family transcriptional regulator
MSHDRELGQGLWDLAVLCLLYERPMHPYEVQKVLRERHKDQILGLKRGSLYHAIGRLERAGLIREAEKERLGKRPERTTYEITAKGPTELFARLKSFIADASWKPAEFMAAVSFLVYFHPGEAAIELEKRVERLQAEIDRSAAVLEEALPRAGRINLLETEYIRAMQIAELTWITGILDEMRSGSFTWDIDGLLQVLRQPQRK